MVSGAVDELRPEDVSIVDADSARSLGLGHDGQDDQRRFRDQPDTALIATLEPVVGADKIRASVNVDHDRGHNGREPGKVRSHGQCSPQRSEV
jgi:flagellar M-ring protein FliF